MPEERLAYPAYLITEEEEEWENGKKRSGEELSLSRLWIIDSKRLLLGGRSLNHPRRLSSPQIRVRRPFLLFRRVRACWGKLTIHRIRLELGDCEYIFLFWYWLERWPCVL